MTGLEAAGSTKCWSCKSNIDPQKLAPYLGQCSSNKVNPAFNLGCSKVIRKTLTLGYARNRSLLYRDYGLGLTKPPF